MNTDKIKLTLAIDYGNTNQSQIMEFTPEEFSSVSKSRFREIVVMLASIIYETQPTTVQTKINQ